MALKYKDILPLGNGLILAGTFFFLGLIFGNFPYDFKTLYSQGATATDFENSLKHYQIWYNTPTVALHILHAFLGLGFIGLGIKIYKPTDETKYFEYGSLVLYVVAVCIYLTNLKTGAESAVVGEWGEVDWMTGVNVIAASEAMMIFLLLGIVALQTGLYWAEWDYQVRLEKFNEEEAERETAEAAERAQPPKKAPAPKAAPKPLAQTTGAEAAQTPKTKQTARKTKKAA